MKVKLSSTAFYKDYSEKECEGWAVLKVYLSEREGYVLASQVTAYKAGKVRIVPESVDASTIYAELHLALKALRSQANAQAQSTKKSERKLSQTLKLLAIENIESKAQIKAAFVAQVKRCATGTGHYTADMDSLVKAKEYAQSLCLY